jgi:hypothetical protein
MLLRHFFLRSYFYSPRAVSTFVFLLCIAVLPATLDVCAPALGLLLAYSRRLRQLEGTPILRGEAWGVFRAAWASAVRRAWGNPPRLLRGAFSAHRWLRA